MKKFLQIIAAIAVCQGAGIVGSLFTAPNIPTWYAGLVKPAFSPPNWLFAPVWLALYTLMGVAVFLVWQQRAFTRVKSLLIVFGLHLVVNALWSVLFFSFHSPLLGLVDIVLLLALIVYLFFGFYRVRKTAGLLLVPYFIWVMFATLLNLYIYRLN